MTALTCPTPDCGSPLKVGQHLCWDCWDALPADARRVLAIRDRLAVARVQLLHQQLAGNIPLRQIEIRL
ncbi:hypothetical protein [Streptomyces sanglieri]|uniref:hypothetical protein n=1 Tax=Streptomyces sanglieri TaxID=193460 RepID=UPI00352342FF